MYELLTTFYLRHIRDPTMNMFQSDGIYYKITAAATGTKNTNYLCADFSTRSTTSAMDCALKAPFSIR